MLNFGEQSAATPAQHWAYTRVALAERFGWRLADVDALSQADLIDVLAVVAAVEKTKAERG